MLNEFSKLQRHLSNDLFDSDLSGDTLYIVDDYNIDSNISSRTLYNFIDAISAVCRIKKVKVFIQMKKRDYDARDSLFQYSQLCQNGNTRKIENNYLKKREFITAFDQKDIECSYVVYPRFNVRPPFHGRYWLSLTGGFIVDGSINTSESKTVLVQVMDEENYGIIRSMTRDIFNVNCPGVDEYDLGRLDDLYNHLSS